MSARVVAVLALSCACACTPAPLIIGDAPPDASFPDAASAPDALTAQDAGPDAALDAAEDAGASADATAGEDSGAHADATATADTGLLGPGDYDLDFIIPAPESVMCADALGGQEALFTGIRPADVGMVPGPITITVTSSTAIVAGGTPILSAFGVATLDLHTDVLPKQPAGTYLGGASLSGPGPNGTHLVEAILAIDMLPEGQNGLAGVAYSNAADSGSCFITFFSTISPH